MPPDPEPFNLMPFGGVCQPLPQVGVLDRLACGGPPAVGSPARQPFGDPLTHVIGIRGHAYPACSLERLERLYRRHQFHAVVGRVALAARKLFFHAVEAKYLAPPARTGIAAAGAVGPDFYRGRAHAARQLVGTARPGERTARRIRSRSTGTARGGLRATTTSSGATPGMKPRHCCRAGYCSSN